MSERRSTWPDFSRRPVRRLLCSGSCTILYMLPGSRLYGACSFHMSSTMHELYDMTM